jgi:hypothetical protein
MKCARMIIKRFMKKRALWIFLCYKHVKHVVQLMCSTYAMPKGSQRSPSSAWNMVSLSAHNAPTNTNGKFPTFANAHAQVSNGRNWEGTPNFFATICPTQRPTRMEMAMLTKSGHR